MKIQLTQSSFDSVECDALIIPMFEDEKATADLPKKLDEKLDGLLNELRCTEEWTAKFGEITVLFRPNQFKTSRLILVGAGKRAQYDSCAIRQLTMQSVGHVKRHNLKRVALYRRSSVAVTQAAQAAIEGVILATYEADDYKTTGQSKNFLEEILLVVDEELDTAGIQEAIERGRILGEGTNLARRLVNEPGNRVGPIQLAETAKEIAENWGLEIEVLEEREMKKKGMDAILGVAQGSDEPPRFIILRYFGANSGDTKPIVLVGKGVTFDSGGLSLKPSQSMEEMKADKAGACAILGAMQAIAQLRVNKNIVGLIPAVENLPSGRAMRPGDVIRSMSGKTIEVINTDAEGRLILADALFYAQELEAQYIIDLATLTGACMVALGHLRAGLFSNDEGLCTRFLQASERSGEKFWRLPLDDEYRKQIETQIADIKNIGSRWGGAITAAKFLQEFVGDIPWCHIDMAGVDLFGKDQWAKGPTGFGVRTLVEVVSQ